MKIELEDISHDETRKNWTYIHDATLKVTETDDSGVTETEENGYIIQGKDMLYLNAPKVYMPNLPTDRQDIAGAFEEILGKLQGEGGGDDWYPPDWWLPVPEPQEYDIYALIYITGLNPNYTKSVSFGISSQNSLYIDWGDGTINDNPSHGYSSAGQFLIHIVCTPQENKNVILREFYKFNVNALALKIGSKIFLGYQTLSSSGATNTGIVGNDRTIFYVKINNQNGLLDAGTQKPLKSFCSGARNLRKVDINLATGIIPGWAFSDCMSLNCNNLFADVVDIGEYAFNYCKFQKIDMPKVKTIKQYAFLSCYTLHEVNAPNCEQIHNSAFSGNETLETLYAPNCTYVGDQAFQNCWNLHTLVLADNCTFGNNCFGNCQSLYPRPDGSTT